MIHPQRNKVGALIEPASFAATATASGTFDCKSYGYATIDVVLGTADDTAGEPTTMQLSEGDTSSSFATWSGSVGGTDFTIPASVTEDPQIYTFNVDLKGRKRYLKVEVSPGTTQFLSLSYALSRASTDDEVTSQGAALAVNL